MVKINMVNKNRQAELYALAQKKITHGKMV